jgi:uncharacterized protein (TIGR02452 family)
MSLKGLAQETLRILSDGRYTAPSGTTVHLARELAAAIEGTRLYRPDDFDLSSTPGRPRTEVTDETTQIAARRLIEGDGVADVVLLNFASARNPGGGFLGGAKAQEEDLCRCSGLYSCLITQREYYDVNRAQSSMLYTDHIIYSPRVPFFRNRKLDLMESIVTPSVITAPAPNAGQHLRRAPDDQASIEATLRIRTAKVLSVARENGHRMLLLGAWGCGAFRNDPKVVAKIFAECLQDMGGAFDRVVFAVPAGKTANHEEFAKRFA